MKHAGYVKEAFAAKQIFEPMKMNHMELKNRLVRSATWEGIANPDGSMTRKAYDIYKELAKGGVGAIITGFTSVALAEQEGYEHIILAGHSLGANKVIYYLSHNHDPRAEHFFLLSPANLTHMMSGVTNREKKIIKEQVERGDGDRMLPFPFMGWVECIANTAWDWQFSGLLNNVHKEKDGDFSQAEQITHTGALLVGTYDNFTDGDPSEFLRNLNNHMPTHKEKVERRRITDMTLSLLRQQPSLPMC